MILMLLVYTVYTNTTFASSSIISQLYYIEMISKLLEYSLYALATFMFYFHFFFVIRTRIFYAS
jgi:hypothetical protein